MSSLFGGGGNDKQTVTTKTELPAWLQDAAKATIQRATGVAMQPYTPYQGPRVAGLGGNQQTAIANAGQNSGAIQNELGQSAYYASQGARPIEMSFNNQPIGASTVTPTNVTPSAPVHADQVSTGQWNQGAAQQYMNPFIKQALDPAAREIADASNRQRNQRNATAVSRGAFGGSRQAIEDMLGEKYNLQQVSDLYGQGYAGAYDRGQSAYQADQGRALQAQGMNQGANLQAGLANSAQNFQAQSLNQGANLQGQLSNQAAGIQTGKYNQDAALAAFQANLQSQLANRQNSQSAADTLSRNAALQAQASQSDLQNLMTTGALQRGATQTNYDTAYNDFLAQRDWDQRGLDAMLRSVSGVPYPQTTQGQQIVPGQQSNILGQLGGLGLAAYGLFG